MSINNVQVTLKTHKQSSGFINQCLVIPQVKYGTTIQSMINSINQFRGPNDQINHLYNQYGQELKQNLWKIQIKEKLTLYIDIYN